MKFEEMTVGAFINELGSDSPAPGGGSVAALCGSLGAALTVMVGCLTTGKEKYKENWEKADMLIKDGKALQNRFVTLMNEDTESFDVFMTALKMPKATEEEKAARREAMENAAKGATLVPLTTLETCVKLATYADEAAKYGNPNALSDAGVASLLAIAGAKAASYNVRINLPGVKDQTFVKECTERMEAALAEIEKHYPKAVEDTLSGK
ncbi:MAG: cyclodeaminase/cyclohydrolase family protein [Synergistes sp.]|nr:cyclodeaminase/cyclohydrolase family protein [Synergistes sp.]